MTPGTQTITPQKTIEWTHLSSQGEQLAVKLDGLLPLAGQLTINIQLSTMVNVTAFSARQKVTGFVADQVSTNMHGGKPTLMLTKRIYWRVPVILSMPPLGDRGEVGAIDVDVETGQLQITPALLKEIRSRAEHLAVNPSPTTA